MKYKYKFASLTDNIFFCIFQNSSSLGEGI